MKRILIVDDAIDLGRLLQDVLKTVYPGVPVTVVPSAEEALLESTRYTFDLLVTDVRLPGMSGMELIRKIRVRQPKIKVIMMTGLTVDDRLLKQRDEAKPDEFLIKPLTPTIFLEAIERLTGGEAPAQQPAADAPTKPLAAETPRKQEKAPAQPAQTVQLPGDAAQAQENLLNELASILPGEPAEKQPLQTRRFTTGRLGTSPLPAITTEESGFSTILASLRSSLGAVVAMLLDERGYPVAQAGDLDPALQNQLVAPMLGALSASAKVAYLLGLPDAEMVQAYRGADLDLVIAPVGQFTLLIGLKAGRSSIRMALAFEEALNAQGSLAAVLEGMGLHVQSAVEAGAPETLLAEKAVVEPAEDTVPPEILDTPLGQDLNLEKFEELFAKKKTGQLATEDPDAFWESASTTEKTDVSQSGMLTFEQAQKLGLLPSDEETK